MVTKASKKAGRRRVYGEADEIQIHHLYVVLDWTAGQVRNIFPLVTETGIREIAARVAREISQKQNDPASRVESHPLEAGSHNNGSTIPASPTEGASPKEAEVETSLS